jgi:DNA-binding transcriptional LysR family regulator
LGRTLFSRTPKGLIPTQFGAEVLSYLERGFRELSRGVALAQEPNHTLLTVSVAPVFAAKWLVPRLHSFQLAHPDLHVRMILPLSLLISIIQMWTWLFALDPEHGPTSKQSFCLRNAYFRSAPLPLRRV